MNFQIGPFPVDNLVWLDSLHELLSLCGGISKTVFVLLVL